MYTKNNISISMWADEDQPRQKLITYGKNTLTDAELLALIIGSGTVKASALDLSKLLIQHFGKNLSSFKNLRVADLTKFPGIGPAKAVNIIASLEMGRRVHTSEQKGQTKISSSHDAYVQLRDKFDGLQHEEFWIILLNRRNAILSIERISIGGVAATMVDPKIIFARALEKLACSIILAHNHPSGNLEASMSDIQLTTKLQNAAKFLDVSILDHLIITDESYYSFGDEGRL